MSDLFLESNIVLIDVQISQRCSVLFSDKNIFLKIDKTIFHVSSAFDIFKMIDLLQNLNVIKIYKIILLY